MKINVVNFNNSSFDFKFKTSSGDEIDLKMFDYFKQNIGYKKENGITYKEFSLKHEYGYEFHYKGNGLDENDLKEIEEAIKKIKPLFEKFLDQKEKNDQLITNTAHTIKSLLPIPKNENHLNFIKSNTLDAFDKVLQNFNSSLKEIEKVKKLFDKIFDLNQLDIFV